MYPNILRLDVSYSALSSDECAIVIIVKNINIIVAHIDWSQNNKI